MNFIELATAAEAAYEAQRAAFTEWLKTREGRCPTDNGVSTEVNGVKVSCMVSDGSANGRSRNRYRYNYKINGKRAKAHEAAAAFDDKVSASPDYCDKSNPCHY